MTEDESTLNVINVERLLNKAKDGPIKIFVLISNNNEGYADGIIVRQVNKHSRINCSRLDYSALDGTNRCILLNRNSKFFTNYWLAYAFCLRHKLKPDINYDQ